MHQNRFRLGLRPRTCWGSLQRSPRPLAGFKGPTSKGREREGTAGQGMGRQGKGGEGRSTCLPPRFEGREREGRGRGEEGRERGEEGKGKGGRKGKGGERDLAPLEKKSWRRHWECPTLHRHAYGYPSHYKPTQRQGTRSHIILAESWQ